MVVAKAVSVVFGVVKRHHHLNQTLTDCYLSLRSLTRSPAFRNKDNHARPEAKKKESITKSFCYAASSEESTESNDLFFSFELSNFIGYNYNELTEWVKIMHPFNLRPQESD